MSRTIVVDIVQQLQTGIEAGLTDDLVEELIDKVETRLPKKYHYDQDKFPPLERTKHLSMGSIDTPQSVAEAYIWKQGDWLKYQKFVGWYYYPNATPPDRRIVLYAFAKHLRDPRLPIFDQHALRSFWALSDALWNAGGNPIKAFLVTARTSNWKKSGNGPTANACYHLFRDEFLIVCAVNRINSSRFDQLLWSLGKALKTISKTHTGGRNNDYEEFCSMIGRTPI